MGIAIATNITARKTLSLKGFGFFDLQKMQLRENVPIRNPAIRVEIGTIDSSQWNHRKKSDGFCGRKIS
jgi:hypothetical protein